jgi:hypothetical protein
MHRVSTWVLCVFLFGMLLAATNIIYEHVNNIKYRLFIHFFSGGNLNLSHIIPRNRAVTIFLIVGLETIMEVSGQLHAPAA